MTKRETAAEQDVAAQAEAVWGITQGGEAVPAGYTFDPRHEPPLYKTPAHGERQAPPHPPDEVARGRLNDAGGEA